MDSKNVLPTLFSSGATLLQNYDLKRMTTGIGILFMDFS
jgi:hypothetical protein